MLGKIVFSNGKHTLFNGVIVFFLLYTLAFVVANMKHYFWSTSHTNKRIHKRKKKNTNVSFIFGQNKTEGFFYSALFYYFLSLFFRSRMFFLAYIHSRPYSPILIALLSPFTSCPNPTGLVWQQIQFIFVLRFFVLTSSASNIHRDFEQFFFFTSSIEFFFICICSLSFLSLLKSFSF